MRVLLYIALFTSFNSFGQNVDSLINLINTTNNKQKKAELFFDIAFPLVDVNPEQSYLYANKLLEFSQTNDLKSHKASAFNVLGILERGKGNYNKSIEYSLKSIRIYDSLKRDKDVAMLYNNLGVTHMYNEVYSEAIKNYTKALSIAKEIDNSEVINMSLNNLGIIYCYDSKFDKGIEYFKQSLVIEEKNKNLKGISECHNNIGGAYYYINELDSALFYFKKAFDTEETLGDVTGMSGSLSNIGEVYTTLENFEKAEPYLFKALELTKKHQIAAEFLNTLLNLSEFYEKKGDLKQALHYSKEHFYAKDSIHFLKKTEEIAEMQTKYDTEKKDQEILHKNEVIQKDTTLKNLLYGLIGIIIILFVLFYFWYKSKQKQKLQSELLKEKEKGIAGIIDAQEEERKRIAKDLHDGIVQELTSLKFKLKAEFEKSPSKSSNDIFNQLEESTVELRNISHQMMPTALTQLGVIEAIRDMLHKSLDSIKIKFNFETFGITERLKENIEITIYRVSQELINNIVKHSGANEVSVQLFKSGKNVILIIEDNGKGISDNAKKDGIGLMNISSRLDTINGKVNFEASPNSGTLATVKIPIND